MSQHATWNCWCILIGVTSEKHMIPRANIVHNERSKCNSHKKKKMLLESSSCMPCIRCSVSEICAICHHLRPFCVRLYCWGQVDEGRPSLLQHTWHETPAWVRGVISFGGLRNVRHAARVGNKHQELAKHQSFSSCLANVTSGLLLKGLSASCPAR